MLDGSKPPALRADAAASVDAEHGGDSLLDAPRADRILTHSGLARQIGVSHLAEQFGRTKRSVIARLVKSGVYETPVKAVKTVKDEGPTKKELVAQIAAMDPDAPQDALMATTKAALEWVIALLESVASGEVAEDQADAA